MTTRYFVKLKYIVHATARFTLNQSQLDELLNEERYGAIEGDYLKKAETLLTENALYIASSISAKTNHFDPIEFGNLGFPIEQDYRNEESAEIDESNEALEEYFEANDMNLSLGNVLWLDDVEVEEHESTY